MSYRLQSSVPVLGACCLWPKQPTSVRAGQPVCRIAWQAKPRVKKTMVGKCWHFSFESGLTLFREKKVRKTKLGVWKVRRHVPSAPHHPPPPVEMLPLVTGNSSILFTLAVFCLPLSSESTAISHTKHPFAPVVIGEKIKQFWFWRDKSHDNSCQNCSAASVSHLTRCKEMDLN